MNQDVSEILARPLKPTTGSVVWLVEDGYLEDVATVVPSSANFAVASNVVVEEM